MEYALLASGSSGNCTLIKSHGHLVMVDVGLGIREIKEKLSFLGESYNQIEAFFITHEHIDHVKSLKSVDINKIYTSRGTWPVGSENTLEYFQQYSIAGFKVTPIPLSHDAKNPIGYIFDDGEEKMVYMTDTGYVKKDYFQYITNANHYIFESNHDIRMLLQTNRPFMLKKRILSDEGHLSNDDAAEILTKVIGTNTQSIVLAHISEEANTPDLVLETFYRIMKEEMIDLSKIVVQVADRHEITKGRVWNEKDTTD